MPSLVKEIMFKEYSKDIKEGKGFVLTEFNGLNVEQISSMRKELRKKNAQYIVFKNKLLKQVLLKNNIQGLESLLNGSTGAVILSDDMVEPIKVLTKFEKDLEPMKIKGGFFDGKILNQNEIIAISKLGSRQELVVKMLGSLQSPIYGLVYSLNGMIAKLVYALNAVKDKKNNE